MRTQIAPRRRLRLAREQIAEHDAVALDVLAGQRLVPRLVGQPPLGTVLGQRRRRARGSQQRPAAGADRARAGAPVPAGVPARARAAAGLRRRDQRAQAREAVAGDAPGGDQLPSASSTSARRRRVAGDDLVEEARAGARQEREGVARGGRQRRRRRPASPRRAPAARGDRRAARARSAPRGWACRPRAARASRPHATPPERQSASSHAGVVADDARRQDRALPGAGRRLEALQLGDHARQARLAVELAARADVLPAEAGSAGSRRR